MAAGNLHATAVLLGDKGVLITGRSGSGKTTLALALIEAARSSGRFARLVADDQLFVSAAGGKLLVEAPGALRGLVEIYGIGPTPIASEDRALIDLVVSLEEAGIAPRFQEIIARELHGVSLPSMALAAKNIRGAVPAICARLQI